MNFQVIIPCELLTVSFFISDSEYYDVLKFPRLLTKQSISNCM